MPSARKRNATKPKRRDKHYSYDENVNEPAKLIDDEPVDIEQGSPGGGQTADRKYRKGRYV